MTDCLLPDRLPEEWRGARLRWVSRIYAGGTPSRERPEYWHEGTIPWLNSGAVNDWAINKPSEYITGAGLAGSSARWIPSSSVVMALAGQGKTKGTAARLEIETTCNQSMAALVPGQTLDYRFLHFWLVANYERIRNLGGGDLRDGLNLQMVGDIEIPLPPVEEQRRIADFLDDQVARIDALAAWVLKLPEQLLERLRSEIATTLDGPAGDTQFDLVPLNRLASVKARIGWRALTAAEYQDSGYAFLSTPNIKGANIDFENVNFIGQYRWDESPELQLCKGDVLLAKDGSTLGICNVVRSLPRPSTVNGSIAVIRPFAVDSVYLSYALSGPAIQSRIQELKDGMGVPHLFQRDINRLRVPLPPSEIQSVIANHLDDMTVNIQCAIEQATQFALLLQERKRALITAAVTGELDVTAAKSIGMGKWVPNVGAGVEAPAATEAGSIGGIG